MNGNKTGKPEKMPPEMSDSLPKNRNTVQRKRKKPTIPSENQDLKKLVLLRKLKLVGFYLLWLACLAVGVIGFNSGHEKSPMQTWQIALWIGGGAVIGFLLLRVWRLFTDRTFTGTITKSGLSHGIKGDDFKTNTAIKVNAEGCNRRLHFEQKENFYTLYHENVEICKFSFLTYPLPNPATVGLDEEDEPCGNFCVVCGHLNKKQISESRINDKQVDGKQVNAKNKTADNSCNTCDICGHSLIQPKKIFGNG